MSFAILALVVSIATDRSEIAARCSKYLKDPAILELSHKYEAELRVSDGRLDEREGRMNYVCDIVGYRDSILHPKVFSIVIGDGLSLKKTYDLEIEISKIRSAYKQKALYLDRDVAISFLKFWKENSKCNAPNITTSILAYNAWSISGSCGYADFEMQIRGDGKFMGLYGGLSGDVLMPRL